MMWCLCGRRADSAEGTHGRFRRTDRKVGNNTCTKNTTQHKNKKLRKMQSGGGNMAALLEGW